MTAARATQKERVLTYLLEHKEGITSLEAFNLFSIMQLPKRIFDLRNDGWKITSIPKEGVNRLGQPVQFVVYKLEDNNGKIG
jgi:hypothetical protein